ncbi:hypothetical protein HN681_04140 [archaeon]|nr:hypothetical protein [archaeon]MBT3731428.1 hypothetical protein [archaeon]MBT4670269.1 hypothetical protein [archaeon]MBT5029713.1 hypothetical protein [archaeon]MBT5287538.1 hypothetical protein [archaeon]
MDKSYKNIGDLLREDSIKETPRRMMDYQHAATKVLDSYFQERDFEKIQVKQEYKRHEDLSQYAHGLNERMKEFQDFHTRRYFEYFAKQALEGLLNVPK